MSDLTADDMIQSGGGNSAERNPENEFLKMTLNSGIAPLELRFTQINHCGRKLPIAYRSFTYVNSITEGVIPPEKYAYAIENAEEGLRLAKWNIVHIIRAIKAFEAAGRHVAFISARCPAHLCEIEDIYTWLKEIFEAEKFETPEKLCLEFPRSVLYESMEKVRSMVIGASLTKCVTMLAGCGMPDSPVTPLLNIPFDYAILAPWLTVYSSDRAKGRKISEFISFLRTLSIGVIGDGVTEDDQMTALNRADCFGYMPAPDYEGSVLHGKMRMTFQEALSQKEEDF